MKKLKALLSQFAKQTIPYIVRLSGANILSKKATLEKLQPYEIFNRDSELISIPAVDPAGLPVPDVFAHDRHVTNSKISVYRLSNRPVTVLSYGGVKLGKDILDLDFGSSLFLKTLFRKDRRTSVTCDTCIVLWSHLWGHGYFDYTYFIFAKLLRIKSAMTETEFKQAKIAYPVFSAPFENELLSYAGISEEQIIDTRKYRIEARHYYLANNDSWYYPNQYDLKLVRETRGTKAIDAPLNERIYISRKGRRKLTNEDEVIALLKTYNFAIIEDKKRSVAEQIAIYQNARIIIGPHGASFANIANCSEGTMLIELYPRNYYPDYFRYISYVFGLKFFAIFEDNTGETHYSALENDFTINVAKLKQSLDYILTGFTISDDSSPSLTA